MLLTCKCIMKYSRIGCCLVLTLLLGLVCVKPAMAATVHPDLGSDDWMPEALISVKAPAIQPIRKQLVASQRMHEIFWEAIEEHPEDSALGVEVMDAVRRAREGGIDLFDGDAKRLADCLGNEKYARRVRLEALRTLTSYPPEQAVKPLLANLTLDDAGMQLAVDYFIHAQTREAIPALRLVMADDNASLNQRLMAAKALVQFRDTDSGKAALEIVSNGLLPLKLKVEAGLLVALDDSVAGLPLAEELWNRSVTDQLLAATLLTGKSESERDLLYRIVTEGHLASTGLAAEKLLDSQPAFLYAKSTDLMKSPHPRVRLVLARVLGGQQNKNSLQQLAQLMRDDNPMVRNEAGRSLVRLASGSMRQDVANALHELLTNDETWTVQSVACSVAGAAELNDLAGAVAALLHNENPNLRLASLAALHQINSDEAMSRVLEQTRNLNSHIRRPRGKNELVETSGKGNLAGASETELSAAMEVLGIHKVTEAAGLIQSIMAKDQKSPFRVETRATAAWALGLLYQGQASNRSVVRELTGRLTDESPQAPESMEVRRMAAVALGFVGSEQPLETLQDYMTDPLRREDLGAYSRWAVEKITGQPQPEIEPVEARFIKVPLLPLESE